MRAASFALVVVSLALSACELPPEPVAVTMRVPDGARQAFLDTPWPSDLLRRPEGGIDLMAFPNPQGVQTLEEYLELFQSAPGYASSGALYFHVEGGVDPASLPDDPAASMAEGASMFLVELAAPARRIPIEHRLYPDGTAFLPPGSVAVLPMLGAIVRGPSALVVTREAKHTSGAPLGPSEHMRALLTCEPVGVAREPDCRPYQQLLADLALTVDDVALVQLFTPYEATGELQAAFDWLAEQAPPAVKDLRKGAEHNLFTVYEGVVSLAQFQAGTPPYRTLDGRSGGFVVGDDGVPAVQRYEDVAFVLTVPKDTPPVDGWPVVVYGHGTGGDLYSGVGNGPSYEAHQLAKASCAMLATSEPLHRGRAGFAPGSEEIDTFNFLNPVAGRDNWRQSALEKAQLVHAVENLALSADVTGFKPVYFDAERVSYFGHSQGGIVGSLFVGVEHRILGAFLSGAGAGFAPSLIEKTEPVSLEQVIRTLLSLPDDEAVDRFHPVPNLLQVWIEPSEPLNYGRLWRERRARPTPHLVATSGLLDPYTPKSTHFGLAGAFGLPIVEPVSERVPVVELLGIGTADGPAIGNLRDGQGRPLTAGMLQYPNDGHFAVFSNPDAQEAYRLFFATLNAGAPTAQVRP